MTGTAAGPVPRRGGGFLRLVPIGALLCGAVVTGHARAADVTVAFVGDQGTRDAARDVLSLIAGEGVDLLVSGGDLGYSLGPDAWIANMDEILGEGFPVLAAVGNHEGEEWPAYRRWLERRVADVDGLRCDGEIGVKAHCTFRGISILQTAPGVHEVPGVSGEDDYAGYLARELDATPNAWRICSWHKVMQDMQVGGKTDATGWGVYEACREGGGIVATAHEHSYSRTHLMSDFENRRIVHRSDHLEIGPGQTFAFVSGLGGKAIRAQKRDGDWWASIYSATQGATHGALFCTFGERTAECRFKDIAGGVPDRFTLAVSNGAKPVEADTAMPSTEVVVAPSDQSTGEPVIDDEPPVPEPAPVDPEPVAPTPAEPAPIAPTLAEPEPSEPEPSEPEPSEPDQAEPAPIAPTLAEPEPSEPTLAEPEPSEPMLAEPEPSEPEPPEPEPAELAPSEPEPSEPEPAESASSEPEPSEPESAVPAPVEPEPSEPAMAEPVPVEPEPSEPAPAVPSSAESGPAEPPAAGFTPAIASAPAGEADEERAPSTTVSGLYATPLPDASAPSAQPAADEEPLPDSRPLATDPAATEGGTDVPVSLADATTASTTVSPTGGGSAFGILPLLIGLRLVRRRCAEGGSAARA